MVNRVMPASFDNTNNNKDSKIENKLLDAIGASQGGAPDLQGAQQDEGVGAAVAKTRYMEHPGLQLSDPSVEYLSLIHISEPTRPERISYAVFCLKKKRLFFSFSAG